MVEHFLGKEEVGSSILLDGSIFGAAKEDKTTHRSHKKWLRKHSIAAASRT